MEIIAFVLSSMMSKTVGEFLHWNGARLLIRAARRFVNADISDADNVNKETGMNSPLPQFLQRQG